MIFLERGISWNCAEAKPDLKRNAGRPFVTFAPGATGRRTGGDWARGRRCGRGGVYRQGENAFVIFWTLSNSAIDVTAFSGIHTVEPTINLEILE